MPPTRPQVFSTEIQEPHQCQYKRVTHKAAPHGGGSRDRSRGEVNVGRVGCVPSELGHGEGSVQVGVDVGNGLTGEVQGEQFRDDCCGYGVPVDGLPDGVHEVTIVLSPVFRDGTDTADGHERRAGYIR